MKIINLLMKGVYQLKNLLVKESMGIVRTTFVIDENGYIIDVIEKVKVKTQIEELKISWSEYIENVSLRRLKDLEEQLINNFLNRNSNFIKSSIYSN